jgi:hypothetical protein
MKLIFACPTYATLEPAAVISQRNAIMHAAAHAGVTWIGDASPNRHAFDTARNMVAAAACETEADAVFWCDSDVVLPSHAVSALVIAGHDFISGLYFQRLPPHRALIAHFDPHGQRFHWYDEWPKDVVVPIDGCGFGCVLTSVRMLRTIREQTDAAALATGTVAAPWFAYKTFSEDFAFCRKAAEAGFQLHVDTGVVCGHLADPVPIGESQFRALQAQRAADSQSSAA